jgi:GNAT superfamily N-acetyltransferase
MFTIDELDDATVEAAGALIAHEQVVAARAFPSLPALYTDSQACTAALQRLRDAGHRGAVAVEGDRMVAVLTGTVRGTQVHMNAQGLAVAPELPDPTTVLARLYGELAPGWVAAGALLHYLEHLALTPQSGAVANLGFGRHHVYAAQPAAPRSTTGTEVQVRVGGTDDLAAVARLSMVELEFRATPPIYSPPPSPPPSRTVQALVDEHRALQDRGAVHLIATVGGRDVGLLTIELTSPSPRLCAEAQPYIGPTATHPDVRGQGVGRALVDAALTWAHTAGYQWVSVDFEPRNPLSRPFWLGNGFQPVGYCVVRTIRSEFDPNTAGRMPVT